MGTNERKIEGRPFLKPFILSLLKRGTKSNLKSRKISYSKKIIVKKCVNEAYQFNESSNISSRRIIARSLILDIFRGHEAAKMTTAVSVRTVRSSPFRESEWDSRLDHLLEDLENSTQRSHSVERKTTTSFASASSQSTCVQQSGVLSKSKSTSSLTGAATDNMLKDLDTALKASTNYIESHRSVQLPNGHQEYHESRYTSTSGVPPSSTGDFNLERQVFSTATVVTVQ